MELELAERLAVDLLATYELSDWTFKFNSSKRMLGICKAGKKQIEMSAAYVYQNEEPHVRDTILHEIAHALVGVEHGHDDVWKEMCRLVGCSPKACDNSALLPAGTWQARCTNCLTLFNTGNQRNFQAFTASAADRAKGKLLFKKIRKRTFKPVAAAKVGRIKAPRQLTLPLPDVF